jgi:hypothetical protein
LAVASENVRVARALDLLTEGLSPFVQREMSAVFRDNWVDVARGSFRNDRIAVVMAKLPPQEWDAQALLSVMWDQWNAVFRHRLGLFERSLVSELREFRNRWAHQGGFDDNDTYRVVDSVQRLLAATGSPVAPLDELERIKLDVIRDRLNEHVEENRQRSNPSRELAIEISLFVISCLAVVVSTVMTIVRENPVTGLILVAFTIVTFTYLIVQRVRRPPMIHSVHECRKCRKIIYSEICPYCTASTAFRSAGSLRDPS